MTRRKSAPQSAWLGSLVIFLATVGLITLSYWATFTTVRENHKRATNSFHQMRTELRETEEARRLLESQIESLRTHVDAVRLQARNEFRLILPGERIEVFAIDESTASEERLLANTRP